MHACCCAAVPYFRGMARLRSTPPPASAANDSPLVERMRRIVKAARADSPLPTTRELGVKFGVANTTIFRALRTLVEAGEIWQHPANGRYYQPAARNLLDRPKPVACLIRRLELGSELYRELLEGVSAGCGKRQRTMLLWHDELLVNHPDPHKPPLFAPVSQQRAILGEFLGRHGNAADGYILDHVWDDAALAEAAPRLLPAVVLFRSCSLEGFSNVAANFRGGALKALVHLLGKGYEQIVPVAPFSGDPAVEQFSVELSAAATELGCAERLAATADASTHERRAALVGRLRRSPRRTALLCPEDNIAALLLEALREAQIRCPESVGLLSVMGTDFAVRARISCVRYDFRLMGRLAVAALAGTQSAQQIIEPQFVSGETT